MTELHGIDIPSVRVVYKDASGRELAERTLKVTDENMVVLDDVYHLFRHSDAELAYKHPKGITILADPNKPTYSNVPFPSGSTVEVFVLRQPGGAVPWLDRFAAFYDSAQGVWGGGLMGKHKKDL